jgi:isopentenyl-diphosphate delta-isomerase
LNFDSNKQHRTVSSEQEELILVDADDNEIAYRSKAQCHDGPGVLHRAFSLFLFNERGELLLQQRSVGKRLWPGFWSNSCCSHPRRGESLTVATSRRLHDELNISAQLEYVYRFCYQVEFDERGSENELCHVYLGRVSGEVQANDHEVEATRYLSAEQLDKAFVESSDRFTPWFKQEWRRLNEDFREQLNRYAM